MVRGTEQSLLASWLTDVADVRTNVWQGPFATEIIFFNLNIFLLCTYTRHDKD